MTPFDGACYGMVVYLVIRGISTLAKQGEGPEGWSIRVYPFTMLLWAGAGALASLV